MSNYWKDRMAAAQQAILEKSDKAINRQLRKYYQRAMERTIAEFERTYNKLLASLEADKTPTPADLYKLDSYWKLQGQMRQELQRLGDRQIAVMSKIFEENYFEIYYSFAWDSQDAFSTLDTNAVKQLINQIWVADGKSWSQRIWDNTSLLMETLNEGLLDCVASGKPVGTLKRTLMERFNVSYGRADALARTELAHIQTEAAKKRYEDYGIGMVEIWADKDERRCDVCGKLHQTKYPVGAAVPIPAHPRCRCCIVPVVED